MSRYYFHVQDGGSAPDSEGVELPDLAAARRAAVQTACAMIGQNVDKFWTSGEWQMTVSDDSGLTQFTLTMFATDAPAAAKHIIQIESKA